MKDAIRNLLLQQRLALSSEQVQTWSQSIILQLRHLPVYQRAKVVGLYSPIKHEPDLTPLLQDSKRFLLPKVMGDSMIYVHWNGKSTQLTKSTLHILEPKSNKDESASLDVLIIPGIAFTKKGDRLGFGKGFFDRFLMTKKPPYVIGVAYPFQLVSTLPTTLHDQRVDHVLIG